MYSSSPYLDMAPYNTNFSLKFLATLDRDGIVERLFAEMVY